MVCGRACVQARRRAVAASAAATYYFRILAAASRAGEDARYSRGRQAGYPTGRLAGVAGAEAAREAQTGLHEWAAAADDDDGGRATAAERRKLSRGQQRPRFRPPRRAQTRVGDSGVRTLAFDAPQRALVLGPAARHGSRRRPTSVTLSPLLSPRSSPLRFVASRQPAHGILGAAWVPPSVTRPRSMCPAPGRPTRADALARARLSAARDLSGCCRGAR